VHTVKSTLNEVGVLEDVRVFLVVDVVNDGVLWIAENFAQMLEQYLRRLQMIIAQVEAKCVRLYAAREAIVAYFDTD